MEDTYKSRIHICGEYSENDVTEDGDRATSQSDLYYDLKKNIFYTIYRTNYYYGNDPISENTYSVSEKEAYDFFKMYANENDRETLDDKVKEIFDKFERKQFEKSEFDKELSDFINGQLPQSHIFNLGTPSEILQKCGFPKNQRIELSASRLDLKSKLKWHPFELSDVYGLDNALQKPIAVFSYGNKAKSQNVIVNLEKDGKNFLAGVHLNQKTRKYEVADIRTLFPKNNIEWLNWINQGKMVYGDKEKLQALIAQQRINVAEVSGQVIQRPLHEHCLEYADSILQKFGDVKDIFTDGHAFYDEIRERSEIESKFYGYYTEKGNLDARELSEFEANEFYKAFRDRDMDKIKEYTDSDLHETAKLCKEFLKEKELNISPIKQEKSSENSTKPVTINVNGTDRVCKNGVVKGFENAVKQNDELVNDYNSLVKDYNSLAEENAKLREQLQSQNNNNTRKSSGNSYS